MSNPKTLMIDDVKYVRADSLKTIEPVDEQRSFANGI